MKISTKQIAIGAVTAAIYAAITLGPALPLSYQASQLRIAEALTVLPFFAPATIPGLFIGCLIANIASDVGPLDIIFGSLATLVSAILTYYSGKIKFKFNKFLAPLPPVIINAVVVGYLLNYAFKWPLVITMLQVGLGQFLACYGLGLPLLYAIEKNKELSRIFKR